MHKQVLILSETISNRLKYVCDVIFGSILKTQYSIVTDRQGIEDALIINYSAKALEGSVNIMPAGLLDETDIRVHDISFGKYAELPTLYHTNTGDIPFDIFSAVFYMLTRYEEYLPFESDEHRRFAATQSIAYRNGFHDLPVVELWTKLLADKLGIPFPAQKQPALITIDIDSAWKYKRKGVFRNFGGLFKSLFNSNSDSPKERLKVLFGLVEDPFDSYDYLESVQNKYNTRILYFVLCGRKSKYDVAYSLKNSDFQKLIGRLQLKGNIGIHPSYASNSDKEEVTAELKDLSKFSETKIKHSRQHFLVVKFPETYLNLIELGIEEEFSMGWHDKTGFRAGISRPFPFYDIKADKQTSLQLHPFVAMDRTLKDYMQLSKEEAFVEVKRLKELVNRVGGRFIMIWHNDSTGDCGEWKGWRKVFEEYYK